MQSVSEIELATNQDLPEIRNLLESVSVPTEGIDPDFTKFFVFRDETSNNIIGCIGLELFTGGALLRSFAVDMMHQGENLGSLLVEKLLVEAAKAGTEMVYSCTAKAPSLFLKRGFIGIDLDDVPREIRESKLFSEICPRVASFLVKRVF